MMGNIFDPWNVPDTEPYTFSEQSPWITHHYNILTHQNQMKPQSLCTAERGKYNEANIATAKRMIEAARAKGIKIQGHCLLWHSQIPAWQASLRTSSDTREQVLDYLKQYVTDIVTEFKGTIYAWDVLNEAFIDGGGSDWRKAMRDSATEGNPWYMKLGGDFVYEGFLAARQADPDAILYYNDYSLDLPSKARAVRDMVHDVNDQYAAEYPEANGRLLIEGIGMQSHHNSGVTAADIKKTLDLFRPLGVLISISELDVLAQSYSEYETRRPVTIPALLKQANQYGDYFKLFLEYSDIIERVTFWGHSDSYSWRSSAVDRNDPDGPWRGLPTPFDRAYKAKPAYYKMIEALDYF
jgi:endo-1,4-beta-xylanase